MEICLEKKRTRAQMFHHFLRKLNNNKIYVPRFVSNEIQNKKTCREKNKPSLNKHESNFTTH